MMHHWWAATAIMDPSSLEKNARTFEIPEDVNVSVIGFMVNIHDTGDVAIAVCSTEFLLGGVVVRSLTIPTKTPYALQMVLQWIIVLPAFVEK